MSIKSSSTKKMAEQVLSLEESPEVQENVAHVRKDKDHNEAVVSEFETVIVAQPSIGDVAPSEHVPE